MTSRSIAAIGVALLLIWRVEQTFADAEPLSRDRGDCGMLALYYMLRLEGRSVDLGQLESMLGTPTAEGHSFLELREVSGRLGLKLDAVGLPKGRSLFREPMIAFVREDGHGHFLAFRTVGHTGRLIQVFDGEDSPVVADAEWLLDSPAWTGLVLVPRRPNYVLTSGISIAGACVAALAWRHSARRPRGSKE